MLEAYARTGDLPYGASKHLRDGIREFKFKSIRVLYFVDDKNGSLIICSHGFEKQTQKTPDHELEKALNFKKDYNLSKVFRDIVIVEGDDGTNIPKPA